MIKKLYLFGIIITVASMIVFAGCGQKYNAPKAIVGEWTCHEFASDEMTDTSFYALTIKEDGTFSLYDYASGNPGISGKMYCDDTGNLGIINIECDEADFDPPACWPSLGTKARRRYKALNDGTIRLGYTGIWLIFDPKE